MMCFEKIRQVLNFLNFVVIIINILKKNEGKNCGRYLTYQGFQEVFYEN